MSAEKPRVLVAEDNSALAGVIAFNLRAAGLEVEVAADGAEAWQRLQGGQFDLVLMDQQMPELSGVELCRLVRERPELREIPVIMITAKGLELEVSQLKEQLGVADVFLKPFSPRELLARVQECLSQQGVAVDGRPA